MSDGCYGLRLPDLTGAGHLLRPLPADAPTLRVTQSRGAPRLTTTTIGADGAAVRMARDAGDVLLDRASGSAHFRTRVELPDDHLVHPHLSLVSAIVNRWLGRDPVHAGAFQLGRGAWGVLGERDSGKSSLLAQVHQLGLPVLTDDVVVVQAGVVLPGPGMVDLRQGAAEHLGTGEAMGVVGRRERWRVVVPPAAPAPLAGWVVPMWGEPAVAAVPPTARLPLLMGHSAVQRPPADPVAFFDLASVPVLVWRRPRDWSRMAGSTEHLLAELTARS